MAKERVNALDSFIAKQLEAAKQAELEGRPGRQRRLKNLILTSRIENVLGARVKSIPLEIRRVVNKGLSETVLRTLWYSPTIFLWRDQSDPLMGDFLKRSPSEMWKENRYREDIVDFMRVMADNLEP